MIGNIHSPSIFIDRGVEFQGSCRMDAIDGATTAKPVTKEAPAAKATTTAS